MSVEPTFSGEMQLAGWKESHTSGATVTFWLPDAESLDVFRGLTAKKGNQAGHRFMAVLVEIGDDEQPVVPQPTQIKPTPEEKGGDLAKLAGILCATPRFWTFITAFDAARGWRTPCASDAEAKAFLYNECRIDSRRMLDHNAEAAAAFHQIRRAWVEWQEANPA